MEKSQNVRTKNAFTPKKKLSISHSLTISISHSLTLSISNSLILSISHPVTTVDPCHSGQHPIPRLVLGGRIGGGFVLGGGIGDLDCRRYFLFLHRHKCTFNPYILAFFHFGSYISISPVLVLNPINACYFSYFCQSVNGNNWAD